MITNFKISNLYVSHGDTTQNASVVLLTGSGCSVGSLDISLQECDGEKVIQV
jgi:hypothetical protein